MNQEVKINNLAGLDIDEAAILPLGDRQILDALPVALYVCDKNGRITYFNEAAVKLWGYTPNIGDPLVRYCACYKVFVNGVYVPPDETPMALALATGQSFRNVGAIVERPDGTSLQASLSIDTLLNDESQVIGAVNVFQDVSEVKKADSGLKENEEYLRQLLNTLDTPLYTTDAEGRIEMFNQAAIDLWGRKPTVGKDLWCGSFKILQTDGTDLPLDRCPMAVCLRERRPVYGEEILVIRPDGAIRNVAPHPQPLYDGHGKMTGAINMLIDITELKQKEKALLLSEEKYRSLANSLERMVEEKIIELRTTTEELRKSEEKYHKMVEEVEDYAIILLDREGIIQNWNKGAEKIKGYKEKEIVGKSFQDFYLQEDRESGLPLQFLKEAREKGKAVYEGWRKRKDGSAFWGSVVLTTLHDAQGTILGFSKLTRDLTDKKQAEDRMKSYLGQLEFKNKELEQFVYASSHDMKAPLRKIRLYNSYVVSSPANQMDQKSIEYLRRSIQAVERMNCLIDDLLAYSKITNLKESFEAVDLNKIIDEIIVFQKDELEKKNIAIHRVNLPVIRAVPFQIKQLMSNLIENAIKYSDPERDGNVSVETATVPAKALGVATDPFREYHHISVKDNGIGIESDFADKIFELFQRLPNSVNIKGSGIGLAICKKIVQNHNGFIKASGSPGKGTTFSIYLPME